MTSQTEKLTNELAIVLVTVPNPDIARSIATEIVQSRLAACVNIVPGIKSIFRWEGKLDEADELLLVIKTIADRYPALEKRITELHPYDTPEIVALETRHVVEKYLRWVKSEVKS